MSGVDVATMIRSISEAATPAASSAFFEASQASSLLVTPGSAKCRASIPVRSTIHSFDVSIPRCARSAASSSLVMRRGGR